MARAPERKTVNQPPPEHIQEGASQVGVNGRLDGCGSETGRALPSALAMAAQRALVYDSFHPKRIGCASRPVPFCRRRNAVAAILGWIALSFHFVWARQLEPGHANTTIKGPSA